MDKLTEYALTHRPTGRPVCPDCGEDEGLGLIGHICADGGPDPLEHKAAPTDTEARPWGSLTSMCRNCNHSIMSVVSADGRILPWWHRVTGLERCEGWSSR